MAKVKEIVREIVRTKEKAKIVKKKEAADKKATKKASVLSFVVPEALNKKLLSYAKDKKLSRSYVGRQALEEFLVA